MAARIGLPACCVAHLCGFSRLRPARRVRWLVRLAGLRPEVIRAAGRLVAAVRSIWHRPVQPTLLTSAATPGRLDNRRVSAEPPRAVAKDAATNARDFRPARHHPQVARELAEASIKLYGGRYIVRLAEPDVPEGDWPLAQRVVIVEFPDMQRAREWYASPEYAEALAVRRTALHRRLLFAEGIAGEAV
jgi:uncharacterized protein (DUF1330 family)